MYAKLKGAKVFSTIDLRSGYHHIALGKSSRAKTAFVMPFGKYEFLMVPFGLAQALAYFQLLMNKVLKGLKFTMTYLDDIIIFSQDESQHLEHLEIVFSHLQEAGLKMKHSKCDFFKRSPDFTRRNQPITQQIRQYKTHACAKQRKRNQTVLRVNWLL